MTDLFGVAAEAQAFFEARAWPFCIIGGVAALHWGEPRVTRDVDMTLITGFGGEERFIEQLLARFQPRIPGAMEFALQSRVVLLQTSDGIGIDVALGALPFEQAAVDRSRKFEVAPGIALRICSAEDLIVFKSFAARPLDWRDVEAVVARQGSRLDWSYIETQLAPLAEAKEQPELLLQLRAIRAQFSNSQ